MYTTQKFLECGSIFKALKKEINRGYGKFCNRKCSGVYNGRVRKEKNKTLKTPNVTCAFCSKDFYKSNSKLTAPKSGLHFCTRKCKDLAQRIGGIKEIQPEHYGTRTSVLSKDYRPIAFEKYEPICMKCGYSKHPEILHVHHKDRDRANNSVDNLEILCPTCHDEDHFLASDGRFS
jgi:hypothetical protein